MKWMQPIYIRQNRSACLVQREMAKLLQRVEITLRSFYIFNSTLGQKEGEVSNGLSKYQYKRLQSCLSIGAQKSAVLSSRWHRTKY